MQRFSKILVAIEASAEETPVLECAAQLALAHGASLTIVDVIPEFGWAQRLLVSGSEHIHQLLEKERAEMLAAKLPALRERGLTVASKVLRGKTSTAIIDEVNAGGHDLVMRNAKGSTSRRLGAFGTTSFELLRRCPCAVYLHQSRPTVQCSKLAAAVDANPEEPEVTPLNRRILETAVAIRDLTRAQLDVIHVWSIYGERMVKEYMRTSEFVELEQSIRKEHLTALAKLLTEADVELPSEHLHLIRGEPTIEIPNFARDNQVDLLVMGTVGRKGMAGLLLGNTAEMILNQLPCSVLAVKPVEFGAAADQPLFPPEMPPVP